MASFAASVVKLLRGTAAAQALGLLALPLLARWFSPQAFGSLQALQSLLALLLVASSFRLEIAILSVPSDELPHLLSLCAWSCAGVGTVTLVIVAAVSAFAPGLRGQLGALVYALPVLVLLAGLGQVLTYLLLRDKEFGLSAGAKFAQSASYIAAAFAMAAVLPSAWGLAVADGAGRLGLLAACWRRRTVGAFSRLLPSRTAVRSIWRAHRDLVKVTLPGSIINVLGAAYTPLVIFLVFDAYHAGQFTLVERAIGTPIAMIGTAMSQVFMADIGEARRRGDAGLAQQMFRRLLRFNLLAGALPAAALFALAPALCVWLLGPQWQMAGQFAQALTPLMLCSFVVMPVNTVLIITGHPRVQLAWDVGRLLVFGATWTCIHAFGLTPLAAVALHGAVATATYIVYLAIADSALGRAASPHLPAEANDARPAL
jgi:O-antigen/teichoic acid export membrane protein